MATRKEIVQAFPAIDEIGDAELRDKVIEAISKSIEESTHGSLHDIPFAPRFHEYIGKKTQVEHINEVTEVAISIADSLTEVFSELDLDRDAIIAGALLHDISKAYEYHPMDHEEEETELGEMVKHPHYAAHLLAREDFPLEIIHIVMAHTGETTIEPQTIEAYIVSTADHIAVRGLFWSEAEMFKPS